MVSPHTFSFLAASRSRLAFSLAFLSASCAHIGAVSND